jgi:hypothetical protein
MERELALDQEIGGNATPYPYGLAHMAHRAFVYSAGERVESTRLLLHRDPPHVLSLHDTARAACEVGATAAWLGHSKADGTRRLRRLVGLAEESSQYEIQLREALEIGGDSMYRDNILEWAEGAGIAPEKVGLTERVRQAAEWRGRGDYKRLTNFAHNALWTVISGMQEVVAAQRGSIEPIWAHAMGAALTVHPYALAGIASTDRTAGRHHSRHNELRKWAGELEDEVGAAMATYNW